MHSSHPLIHLHPSVLHINTVETLDTFMYLHELAIAPYALSSITFIVHLIIYRLTSDTQFVRQSLCCIGGLSFIDKRCDHRTMCSREHRHVNWWTPAALPPP